MNTHKTILKSMHKSCIGGLSTMAGLFMFVLMSLALLSPTIAQADGLFDFQMKLAQKGNAEAEFKVGEMYETGFGVKKDINEAKTWITKSAHQGNESAKFKLLYWDVEKNGLTKDNKAEAEALKIKANEGNPQAQYYVGKMYANGVGVKKNSDKAISWLNKAALVGVLSAERELVTVREGKQSQDLVQQKAKQRQRANEKKRAELNAKQEVELKAKQQQQAQLEKQRKLQAKKRKDEKARADAIKKQNKAAKDARLAAEQKAKIVAQQEALAMKKREAQKQAELKQRAAKREKKSAQFEADPCKGKSARFLSTCK